MPDEQTTKTLSRLLSKILRHKPELVGVSPDVQGFTDIDNLIDNINHNYRYNKFGFIITREHIDFVVANNDKKRFEISQDGTQIRAVQGHSVSVVNRDFEPKIPPNLLYHGTAEQFLPSILKDGLIAKKRHYVHLSVDTTTAKKVGQRHGKVKILQIDTAKMLENGVEFYQAENGVWLVKSVPVGYLSQLDFI